ncbi:hypothetical protein Tco_1451357 [Tanacetum coccineum]
MPTDIVKLDFFDGGSFKRWQKKPWLNPDISRHTCSTGMEYWDAVNRVFKYLKKTIPYGLEYNGDPSVLEGYTDASWITDQEDYQSLWHWLHATKKHNGYETWHIRLRHRQVNQLINDGVITVSFLRSSKNLADPFTKGLPRQLIKSTCYGNNLDKVHLSECGSEATSYEFKVLALKHYEKPR